MTVLVTGASGHLGGILIKLLVANGFSVRAFARQNSDLRAIAGVQLDLHRGDILQFEAIQRAVSGCSAVFHLAAPTRVVPGIEDAVVAGTKNVLDAAFTCGVETVVYTSSIVTVGYSDSPAVILHEINHATCAPTPYHAAKCAAERMALDYAAKGGPRVVVVNPATIVGSFDYRVTPSNEAIQRALTRRLPFTFDSGVTIAPVRNVAMGHILALRHGRKGERYILGGDRIRIPDYFRLIDECCGNKHSPIHIPRVAMLGIGAAFSAAKLIGQRNVPFSFTQAKHLVGKYGFYSSDKARQELGYHWRPAGYAVADYVKWVRSGRSPDFCPL